MNRLAVGASLALLIAAPAAHAITLADFSVYGVDSVFIGAGSFVHSGLVGSETSVGFNGQGAGAAKDVHSGGTVTMPNSADLQSNVFSTGLTKMGNSNIGGNADVGSFQFTGNSGNVTGTVTYQTTFTGDISAGKNTVGGLVNTTPVAPVLPGLPAASGFAASGAADLPVVQPPNATPGGTITTLLAADGPFGDFSLGSNNRLKLSAGDYYFDSLKFAGGGDLELDFTSGPINLFIVGDLSFGSNLDVILINGDASDIKTEVHGNFNISGGGEWFGQTFVPNGLAKIGNDVQVRGAIWAKDVDVEHSADIYLEGITTGGTTTGGTTTGGTTGTIDGGEAPPGVPEPLTLSLGAMGLSALYVRLRQAKRAK